MLCLWIIIQLHDSRLMLRSVFIVTSYITLSWKTNLPDICSLNLRQNKRDETTLFVFGVHTHSMRLKRHPSCHLMWRGSQENSVCLCSIWCLNSKVFSVGPLLLISPLSLWGVFSSFQITMICDLLYSLILSSWLFSVPSKSGPKLTQR